ncbi:WD40 repeat domain-containing serine/threonine protein kinase [Frankia sp. BMG5.23]|uniref:WD40 repeat domain-containing serine/threonine protein kinase n=1 Tax=Frankia sp. BMG5.23 TaxID=683305 RepID=UPI000460BC01|nr:serine/threonine-protein kinase [Frankia sp. BMG5.23]KDA44820.1 serine/threonine protein kinase [Frankia sp. BMG5.23]
MTGTTPPPLPGDAVRPLQLTDPRRLGVYQVIGRLGQGGMGTVFLGRAPDGSAVAIKMIRPELAQRPEFRARFAREAESARRVRRFTTAAVLDADPYGPQPYLVTEFVEGPTLSRRVSVRGPLRPADLEQLAVSVTTALSAIHAAGIVHRDLTPGNVLLSPVGPKVIDFGLAREFNADTDLSHNVRHAIGTPGYMSPEQILDAPITSAVDIFAWGAVIIFAATGHAPFGTGRIDAILYRIVNEPPRLDGVGGELRNLVEIAMAKDPAARPSAEELRTALIGGGTLPARLEPGSIPSGPPGAGPTGRARRWARRRPSGAAGSVPRSEPPPRGTGSTGSTGSTGGTAANVADMPVTQLSPPPVASPPPIPARTPPPIPARTSPPRGQPGSVPPHPAGTPHPPAPSPSPPAPSPPAPSRLRWSRTALLVAGLAIAITAATVLIIVPRGGGPSPVSAADRASISSRLAADAAAQRARQPDLAGRLSLAAYRIAPTEAARAAVLASFAQSTAARIPAGPAAFSDIALSPDGTTLAGTDDTGSLHLWKVDAAGRPTATTGGSANDHAHGVVFDRSGTRLATGGETDAGRLWDIADPARPRPLSTLDPQATPVHRLALSSSAHLLVTAGEDWSVGLWDVADPARPVSIQLLIGRAGPVTDVALRPDGAVLAIAGAGGPVQLWNVRDPRRPVQTASVPGHTGAVNTVAFSPDGRRLATGGDDRILQVSDVGDPDHPRVLRRLSGHTAPVAAVAFTTDDHLVSADGGGAVAYWDLSAPTPPMTPLGVLDAPARAVAGTGTETVALTTDKGSVLLGTLDPARLRRLACAKPGAALSPAEWSRLVPRLPYTDSCSG